MSRPLMQVLASRWLAIVAATAVIILGVALIVTSLSAARTEAALRQRIAVLIQENRRAAAASAVKLAACQAAGPRDHDRITSATMSDEARARELARHAPAGFDGCARMESADRAVLETLK